MPRPDHTMLYFLRINRGIKPSQLRDQIENRFGKRIKQETYNRWESGNAKAIKSESVDLLANFYNVGEHVICLPEEGQIDRVRLAAWERRKQKKKPCFSELAKRTSRTDTLVAKKLRKEMNIKKSELTNARVYKTEIEEAMIENELDYTFFGSEFLEGERFRQLLPEVGIRLTVRDSLDGPDLIDLHFEYEDSHFTLKGSPLMWPCTCMTSESAKCPLHGSPKRKNLTEAFKSERLLISYDGVQVYWKLTEDTSPKDNPFGSLWPPSIDAFNLAKDMKRWGLSKKGFSSVLDIGSGTGFLGIWVQKQCPEISRVMFTDWLTTPLLYSRINAEQNFPRTVSERHFALGTHFDWVKTYPIDFRRFDLCVCNPPYLPLMETFSGEVIESAVAGTRLLKEVLENASLYAKCLVISFSDLCLPEVEGLLKKIEAEKIGHHKVPFRMPKELFSSDYIQKLVVHRGLEINSSSEHRYWHSVSTYVVYLSR